ncbi:MAG: endonuclease/exonuclease/phosphatase family protein [Gemmatimonadaceae bacterium]|nr:endonuclease/exonuclease/phosphatase family protein [Gemmatimonadaceae bacterium]
MHDTTVERRPSSRRRTASTAAAGSSGARARRRWRLPRINWRRLDQSAAWWLTPLASRRWFTRLAAWSAWGACFATLAVWGALAWRSEQWLAPTLLAYGPRLWLLLPLAVATLVWMVADRRLLLPALVSAGVLVGPIAGWRSGWRALVGASTGEFRVMTLNAAGRALDVSPAALVAQTGADIWAVQECGERTERRLRAELPTWHLRRDFGLCTLSRWPITQVDSMDRADFARANERGAMAAAYVVRATIATSGGPISLVNLHLATARWGLSGFLPSVLAAGEGLADADAQFQRNAVLRRYESERAADWARRQPSPVIVAGDFNLPVESTLYRDYWAPRFTDAFERVGRGFGFTKFERRIRIRIDHLLSDGALRPVRAVVGPDVGSDHRPVIVDYVRR